MDPTLLYYTGVDGWSLTTLLWRCDQHKPTIVLIKTKTGSVFGAYVSDEWHKDNKTYFGDRDTFVFSIHPKEAKYTWKTNCPPFFVLVTDRSISIGHG